MISTDGGKQPRWRRDGKELFYISPDNRLMVVEVSTSPSLKPGLAKPLFATPISTPPGAGVWTWDLTPDGQRFLINAVETENSSTPLTIVLNWQAGLKK